jgi:hypothetical protein
MVVIEGTVKSKDSETGILGFPHHSFETDEQHPLLRVPTASIRVNSGEPYLFDTSGIPLTFVP